MKNFQTVMTKIHKQSETGVIKSLQPLIKTTELNTVLLTNMSSTLNDISVNTKNLNLIGQTLKALTSLMSSFVNILSTNVEEQKTNTFFANALKKENENEAKNIDSPKTPEKVVSDNKKSNFLSNSLGVLGGALTLGALGTLLLNNTETKNKIIKFVSDLIDNIISGLSTVYSTVKTWINDEKNQEKIGNFFTGILNMFKMGFDLIGDLWKVLVKEYEKEDSPLKQALTKLIDSLIGFVSDHPLLALGAALLTFNSAISAMAIGLVAAATLIGKIASALKLGPIGWASLATMLGMDYLAGQHTEALQAPLTEEEQDKRKKYTEKLDKLKELNPEYHKEITNDIAQRIETKETEESFRNEEAIKTPNAKERTKYEALRDAMEFGLFKNREERIDDIISEDNKNKTVADTQRIISQEITPRIAETTTPTSVNNTSATISNTPIAPKVTENKPTTPVVTSEKTKENTQSPTKTTETVSTEPKKINKMTGKVINSEYAMSFFMSKGWSREQAAGIVGNLLAESGLKTDNVNPTSGAYGIAQWLGDRPKNFKSLYGHSLQESTADEQLNFVQWELTSTDKRNRHKAIGDGLKNITSYEDATKFVMQRYEVPSKQEQIESLPRRLKFAKGLMKGDYSTNIESDSLSTANPSLKDISLDSGAISTENSLSNWFSKLNSDFNLDLSNIPTTRTIDKLRGMPKNVINSLKTDGNILNKKSSELTSKKFQSPNITINSPAINTPSVNDKKITQQKETNMTTIFDREFISLLVGRNVDFFTHL